ncbi:hypothetical protein KY334_00125 [Candidatus Woesearchaeota archaeon]|nr:hypothetical protein [Candidatus Woesearchaeota archaeon]
MLKEIKEESGIGKSALDAIVAIGNIVYLEHIIRNMSKQEVCALFETLEREGKIMGNGHHARQEVADFAQQVLLSRWNENDK